MPYTALNFNILGHKSAPKRHGAAAGKQNFLPDPHRTAGNLAPQLLDFVAPSRLAQATSHSTCRGDLGTQCGGSWVLIYEVATKCPSLSATPGTAYHPNRICRSREIIRDATGVMVREIRVINTRRESCSAKCGDDAPANDEGDDRPGGVLFIF